MLVHCASIEGYETYQGLKSALVLHSCEELLISVVGLREATFWASPGLHCS